MPEVLGFKGIRYNAQRTGPLSDVITPPFDVIDPEQRQELFGRSSYNMARLILPDRSAGETQYEHAASLMRVWLEEGVLAQDGEPRIYLVEQRFQGLDGQAYTRRAFFARCKLPEAGEESVLGHERTFRYKIEDRLALTRATQANTGAVFVMYPDEAGFLQAQFDAVQDRAPDGEADTIDEVRVRFWCVPQPGLLETTFAGKTLYIADGHHRFATALAYRDEQRALHGASSTPQAYDYIMLGFVPMNDPGLLVYPAHRVLSLPAGFSLENFLPLASEWFMASPYAGDLNEAMQAAAPGTFGLYVHGHGSFMLKLKDTVDRADLLGAEHGPAWRAIDVALLHGGLLEKILQLPAETEFTYEPRGNRAISMAAARERGAAFLLPPMTPEHITNCADAREFMPQKATYFFPKLPSGVVIHRLTE